MAADEVEGALGGEEFEVLATDWVVPAGAVAGAAVPLSLKAFSGGTPLMQLTLFSLATWFSIKQRMKPLALIGIALLIGLLMVLVG